MVYYEVLSGSIKFKYRSFVAFSSLKIYMIIFQVKMIISGTSSGGPHLADDRIYDRNLKEGDLEDVGVLSNIGEVTS